MARPNQFSQQYMQGFPPLPPFPPGDAHPIELPEETEKIDRENVQKLVDEYYAKTYANFEPEIITTMDGKEYYLPALKVLKCNDGKYSSPGYPVEWDDMELRACCFDLVRVPIPQRARANPIQTIYNSTSEDDYEERLLSGSRHDAPNESCDCGIYGSVNLEEMYYYLRRYASTYFMDDWWAKEWGGSPLVDRSVFCLIEPFPDAKTIICRKGWKTSHAFISEIIGETMSIDAASSLLSLAWHREINLRRLRDESW